MSETGPLQMIQNVLAQEASMVRPSQATCAIIAAMKDLCELQGSADWRRGPAPQSPGTPMGMQRTVSRGSLTIGRVNRSGPSSPVALSPTVVRTPGEFSGHGRYKSKFKDSTQQVEDRILNNIILSKLNKFSPATYVEVRDFLYQILGSGDPNLAALVRDFILLVFKKAASEEVYCPLYAKLLAEISDRYKIILDEMKTLHNNYMKIFEDVVEVPEGGDEYATFVEKNLEKKYRQGYSQFLAELATLEIIDISTLSGTFRILMGLIKRYKDTAEKKTLVDEYSDCLVRMARVFKKKNSRFFSDLRSTIVKECGTALTECIDHRGAGINPKARFLLMDVRDILLAP